MLQSDSGIEFVDAEIAGEVIRVITRGVPALGAQTPAIALQELRENHDDFRRFVLDPPRGHGDVNAALLLPPFSEGAARTLVVAAQFGFAPLAGTPLIASAAVLVATGAVKFSTPTTEIVFDTAKGLMNVFALGEENCCHGARWCTSPPEFLRRSYGLELETGRALPIDVVLTGLPYIVVNESDLGVGSSDVEAIGAFGAKISRAAGRQLPMEVLGVAGITTAYPVLVIGEPRASQDKGTCVPLAWVYANGTVAKMPAGTGALTATAVVVDRRQVECGTIIAAVSPFGGEIRSSVGAVGELVATTAMVEADVAIVSMGHLLGY